MTNLLKRCRFVCLFYACLVIMLAGCAGTSFQHRLQHAEHLVMQRDWHRVELDAGKFVLTAYLPKNIEQSQKLTVYIEGDGLAWISRHQHSDNPTPLDPTGLRMSLTHPNEAVVYLARPCQYVLRSEWRDCAPAFWTSQRFSAEVITATRLALDQLKLRFGAEELELVGYSGGGAVASLVAAERSDVRHLLTVAGNLDHKTWTKLHDVSPLSQSLNPADMWEQLQDVPQRHLIGEKDANITKDVVAAYLQRFPPDHRPSFEIITNFDHTCCWSEKWPALYGKLDSL